MDYTIAIGSLSLSIVDIVIFVICMISAVVGCIRGFVNEFTHQAGIIAGLACGLLFTRLLAGKLAEVLPSMPYLAIALISFVSLVLVGYLLLRLAGSAVSTIVESFHLGALDNILGFLWGLIVSLFVLSALMYVLSLQSIIDFSALFDSSIFAGNFIRPLLPEALETLSISLEGEVI